MIKNIEKFPSPEKKEQFDINRLIESKARLLENEYKEYGLKLDPKGIWLDFGKLMRGENIGKGYLAGVIEKNPNLGPSKFRESILRSIVAELEGPALLAKGLEGNPKLGEIVEHFERHFKRWKNGDVIKKFREEFVDENLTYGQYLLSRSHMIELFNHELKRLIKNRRYNKQTDPSECRHDLDYMDLLLDEAARAVFAHMELGMFSEKILKPPLIYPEEHEHGWGKRQRLAKAYISFSKLPPEEAWASFFTGFGRTALFYRFPVYTPIAFKRIAEITKRDVGEVIRPHLDAIEDARIQLYGEDAPEKPDSIFFDMAQKAKREALDEGMARCGFSFEKGKYMGAQK